MKKIFLLIAALFAFFTALSAQTTQEEADAIVFKRMSRETGPYIVYAKEGIQTKMTIISHKGEVLELDYACWVYYIHYVNNIGQYIIVKESDGNVLEIMVKNYTKPDDLIKWRMIDPEKLSVLHGTAWKLERIIDVENDITVFEPGSCKGCYTLTFDRHSCGALYSGIPFSGVITNNIICGDYEINSETNAFIFTNIMGTAVGEGEDAYLYRQTLWKIQSFKIDDTSPRTLHLYYNDGKNYLKYKEIGG